MTTTEANGTMSVRLIEFEARVNYVVPRYENAVICAYDLVKFGASVMSARNG